MHTLLSKLFKATVITHCTYTRVKFHNCTNRYCLRIYHRVVAHTLNRKRLTVVDQNLVQNTTRSHKKSTNAHTRSRNPNHLLRHPTTCRLLVLITLANTSRPSVRPNIGSPFPMRTPHCNACSQSPSRGHRSQPRPQTPRPLSGNVPSISPITRHGTSNATTNYSSKSTIDCFEFHLLQYVQHRSTSTINCVCVTSEKITPSPLANQ